MRISSPKYIIRQHLNNGRLLVSGLTCSLSGLLARKRRQKCGTSLCVHCRIPLCLSTCSQTKVRAVSIFCVGQYLPSVRRAYSILCLFVTVHLAAGVQGHISLHPLSCPPLARMDDSRYTGGQSFGCGPTSFLSTPQTQQCAFPPFPQQTLQLMYF